MLYTECMTEHMPQSSGYPENAPSKEAFTPARVLAVGRETIRRSGALFAGREPDMIDIMRELEPVVAHELNRHNRMRKPWTGADFLPIDEKTGLILGRGTLEHPENQIILPPAAQAAMLVNLLTEDNLPSYHRLIHNSFPQDSAWATWTNQWTGEEDNHAYVMRSYLDLTRTIDPYLLERERLAQMSQGYNVNKDPIHTLVYVTFQELATRVSHRNTGIAAETRPSPKVAYQTFLAITEPLRLTNASHHDFAATAAADGALLSLLARTTALSDLQARKLPALNKEYWALHHEAEQIKQHR